MQASEPEREHTLSVHSRACQACASSKAKCVPATSETAGKCLRCFKSRKECLIPEKSTKKRKAPGSTTAELEQRIQDLAVILAAQQQAVAKPFPATPESQVRDEATTKLWPASNPVGGFQHQQHLPSARQDSWRSRTPQHPTTELNSMPLPVLLPMPNHHREPSSAPQITPIAGSILHAKDGDYLLKIYRDHFSRRLPFIVVPPTLTARDLQTQRPWLFKAITIAASQDNRGQQLIWAKDLISDLAIAMVVRGERSLDLLQGLIIYNAWAYTVSPSNPQLSSTCPSLMITAMVFDLGLNRTLGDMDLPDMLSNTSKAFGSENNKISATRSMDERRTLLTAYFLTSMVSSSMKRMEGLQFSPYIEHCRQSLLNFAEYESDIVLAALVRIQSIVEKTNRNILEHDPLGGEKVPVWMLSKLARLELKAYWASLTSELRQNGILAMNYQCAEINLFEPCLQKPFFPRDLANGNIQRLSMLHGCLAATQALLDSCLAQPIPSYFTFCIIDITTVALGCSTLLKLSLIDEVDWDLARIRQNVSFQEYLQKFVTNLEQVGLAIDQNQSEPCRPSFFTAGAGKMKLVEAWYVAKIGKDAQQVNSLFPQGMTGLAAADDLEVYGDRFWEDFMVDGGFV